MKGKPLPANAVIRVKIPKISLSFFEKFLKSL